MTDKNSNFRPIAWIDGKVHLIDQTRLPSEEAWLVLETYSEVVIAIKNMQIRGAPAIGIAGAYAVALAGGRITHESRESFLKELAEIASTIEDARPTAVNLSWAVQRMIRVSHRTAHLSDMVENLVAEAINIHDEDEKANIQMSALGANLIPPGSTVLTHCNAGALATGGYGTALGVIRTAWARGNLKHVFATETRPWFQGSRLTAWELMKEGIDATVISDSSVGQIMQEKKITRILVGADRITANGDVANKIGTYNIAVLAKEHDIPLYVAAPTSTIDLSLESGGSVTLEERSPNEITHFAEVPITAPGIRALNRSFDITPNKFVTAIITEKGVVNQPYKSSLRKIMELSNE
ncbi:MAG: S-methyl-5-thioribose-1-phosphate isomerase [SAR202 cluster bacterium]|nr:S-methyl-5-thioribose-1-phosphate isomerase [SAR202 cluster bacterium]|tara:strand:- start:3973 stop:5031 length:1059 start_codon:yes stop_codon:yes gene_type:complete